MNKHILSLISLLFITTLGYSQYNPAKVNKKAIKAYNEAMGAVEENNFTLAISKLKEAVKIDKNYIDAYLSIAGIYGQLKQYPESIVQYENAFAIDKQYTYDFKLPYSINLAAQGKFKEALNAVDELLAINNNPVNNSVKAATYRKTTYEFALKMEEKRRAENYQFNPINMGSTINSAELEYFPSLTIDGKELIFTRRLNGTNEDFFTSSLQDNEWSTAVPAPGNINTEWNEGAQNISLDGEILVFTGCNRPDGIGSCDIYFSYKTTEGWTAAENAGPKVNSDQWDSQPCLSPDKRSLYFSSRRPGGYGGSDIYVAHLQADGRWGTPQNMGPSINTPGDEQSPFIHSDNQTLYFTSNYWPGYGNEDLFMVKKGPGGDWSKPENLGYPINTIHSEGTIYVTPDGNTAYYASDRADSKGGLDIYSFELPKSVRPYKTLWVKGTVTDFSTQKGIPGFVELIDKATGQMISKVATKEDGSYTLTLPTGKDYIFNVNKKGYLFYSDKYLLATEHPNTINEKNISLKPIAAMASIILNNIFFDFNQSELKEGSSIELDKVVQLLKDNPSVKIQIEGHTDNIGKDADNITLAEKRAIRVAAYILNEGGISRSRITYKSWGAQKPIADNSTEEGRARNRRIEIVITEK